MSNGEIGEIGETGEQCLRELERTAELGPIGRLPLWEAFQVDRVEPAVRALLATTEAAFTMLEAEASNSAASAWSTLLDPLERMQVRLGRLLGSIVHLSSVKYSDELQAAYDAVRPDYVQLSNRMAQSRAVYTAMVALRDGPEYRALTQAQQRVLTESIRGMERSGVHLEGERKARYEAVQQQLSELSNRFRTNLVKAEKASRIRVADADWVAGVPAPVLALAAKTAREDGVASASAESGPWHFVVNGVNYLAVLQHGHGRQLREAMYRAFRACGTTAEYDNRPIVAEILRLRQEEALLVGFANYADLSIDDKMAPSTQAVWQLLDELEVAARPAAEKEFVELVGFIGETDAEIAADPQPWDLTFWSEKLLEARYDYDSEHLRDYFQMPRVMAGLFDLIQRLYGVTIEQAAPGAVPVWDPSVEFYQVLRGGESIAGFFVDPYARPGEKRGGAWMGTVVGRSRLLAAPGRKASLPVALFVMNGRPPADGRPALMSLDEVRTLFHEFGHATQHMFTDVDEGGAAGMNLVEWDAVELASQFNEYWMEHKPFLQAMTAHVDSGEPLDDATLDRIIASRNFMVGNATLRQLQFAKTDMALHERYGLPGANQAETPFDIERQIAEATLVMPRLPGESQLPAFGHLFAGGYAAGYYSYKWAEVLAADAFAAFKEAGLEDAQAVLTVAERFRSTVLGLGGSLPAEEVYRRFRGRDPSPQALLVQQGLR